MFEAKTKLSEICDAVHRTGESVLVTRRGKPYVRIVPLERTDGAGSSIWEARERFESEYDLNGLPDFPAVHREREPAYNPFDSDRTE